MGYDVDYVKYILHIYFQILAQNGPFVRPLLSTSKSDLKKYLKSQNLMWMEDSSNEETKYKRNKVRVALIPLASEVAGGTKALYRRSCAVFMICLMNDAGDSKH